MNPEELPIVKGMVEVLSIPGILRHEFLHVMQSQDHQAVDDFMTDARIKGYLQGNMVFNFPRIQYAKLDRGETPEAVNASFFTLSNDAYANPDTTTVAGETLRVAATTKAVDPANPKNSIIRFVLDVGQFTGSWKTAILIGGPGATSTPGTGSIIAAVNDIRDDANLPLNRDGTTVHLVNWKLKHLDSSEA